MSMRFDETYREDLTLRDGTRVRLRMVGPADRQRLERGLLELSDRSRYYRFFTAKVRFTERELDYLTVIDGRDHFALGAVVVNSDDSEGDGIGVARFVRLPGEPDVAEPAIAVVDAHHQKGLGSALMTRLSSAARERGIRTFRTEFLAQNAGIRELLESTAGTGAVKLHTEGSLMTAEIFLEKPSGSDRGPEEAEGPMAELLRLAGRRMLDLRTRFQNLFAPSRIQQAWQRFQGTDPSRSE